MSTDHNIDGTIAFECVLEEGDLIIPVGHVAFDGRGLAMGVDSVQLHSPPCESSDDPPSILDNASDHSICPWRIHVSDYHFRPNESVC